MAPRGGTWLLPTRIELRSGRHHPADSRVRTAVGQSVTGGYVYRGSSYPALRGFYLYGDFGSGNLWAVQPQGSGWDNRLVLASQRQISTFGEDESGELYLADYRGEIYRITGGLPTASVNALSAGSIATVYGTGLTAFPGIVQALRFPLATDLSGTSITLNGVRAPILAVASVNGQEQINFQVPYELANASRTTVVITANGQTSGALEAPIVNTKAEIFAVTRDGQFATVWATGLGAVTNQPGTGFGRSDIASSYGDSTTYGDHRLRYGNGQLRGLGSKLCGPLSSQRGDTFGSGFWRSGGDFYRPIRE